MLMFPYSYNGNTYVPSGNNRIALTLLAKGFKFNLYSRSNLDCGAPWGLDPARGTSTQEQFQPLLHAPSLKFFSCHILCAVAAAPALAPAQHTWWKASAWAIGPQNWSKAKRPKGNQTPSALICPPAASYYGNPPVPQILWQTALCPSHAPNFQCMFDTPALGK